MSTSAANLEGAWRSRTRPTDSTRWWASSEQSDAGQPRRGPDGRAGRRRTRRHQGDAVPARLGRPGRRPARRPAPGRFAPYGSPRAAGVPRTEARRPRGDLLAACRPAPLDRHGRGVPSCLTRLAAASGDPTPDLPAVGCLAGLMPDLGVVVPAGTPAGLLLRRRGDCRTATRSRPPKRCGDALARGIAKAGGDAGG